MTVPTPPNEKREVVNMVPLDLQDQRAIQREPGDKRSRRNKNKDGEKKKRTVVREGGGQVWDDTSLLEWDPNHFRLFCGDLGGETTDDTLCKAFGRYRSMSKARVIRDKRTGKSKGYGFVAFRDSNDFVTAWREMNGKYIGTRPVKLRKATTEVDGSIVAMNKLESKKRASAYERALEAHRGKRK